MVKRRKYDDKFRASAVVMLEAAGYPGKEGALTQVAKRLSVPHNTLRGWYHSEHNPPPSQLRQEKKGDLLDWIEEELAGIFSDMPGKREEASYRDMGTVAGILMDKKQLLTGNPTNIFKVENVSDSDIIREFNQLLNTARERAVSEVDQDSQIPLDTQGEE